MTLLHPARTGSQVAVWFSNGVPVRLVTGGERFRVVDEPRTADINGCRYWRIRAQADDDRTAVFDLRRSDGGWVLAGVEDDAPRPDDR